MTRIQAMSVNLKAWLFTAVPIFILSVIAVFDNNPHMNQGLSITWLVAGDIWLAAILTYIGLRLKEKDEAASGVLRGIITGFVFLALTVIIFIARHEGSA